MREKTIVITGASKGLGKDLALHYCESNRVIGVSRSPGTITHSNYRHYECDIGKADSVKTATDAILKEFPKVDVLVNNAAVLTSLPLVLMRPADIEAMVSVNLMGTILFSRAILRGMMRARAGRIVNITTMAPHVKVVGDSVYAATKAGVEIFASILNREVYGSGIRVNNLAISAYETDMLKQIVSGDLSKVIQHIPHKRIAKLEEVVDVLNFLANPANTDIGGQTVHMGGI